MKFFHISDLHIGKRVCGFSMLEDQRAILEQILELTGKEKPDGLWIAGDLYDKSLPSAEAVELLDWFLSCLAKQGIPVWAISGNHDSAERIAYGSQMLEQAGIHMSRVFDGTLQRYTFTKTVEETKEICDIYLLPFIKPAQVRRFFPEAEIETSQDAVCAILEQQELQKDRRNVLLMHQFLAGASVCDSEEISVGGSDQISAAVVEKFDYVALGHLHGPQKIGRETIRYCGSPLKYSFSEAKQKKSVTVVSFEAEKSPEVYTIPLQSKRDLRKIRGPIRQLLSPEVYTGTNTEDYLHITLTDENPVIDAIGKLREVYPNIMRLDFESGSEQPVLQEEIVLEEKTPQELFEEFYIRQNGKEVSAEQRMLLARIWQSCAAGSHRTEAVEDMSGNHGTENVEDMSGDRGTENAKGMSGNRMRKDGTQE